MITLPENAGYLPIHIPTVISRPEVIFVKPYACDENDTTTQGFVRDVALFSLEYTYDDLVNIIVKDGKLCAQGIITPSQWNTCVFLTKTAHLATISDFITQKNTLNDIAGKYSFYKDTCIFGLAVPRNMRESIDEDLELFQSHGIIQERTWSVLR